MMKDYEVKKKTILILILIGFDVLFIGYLLFVSRYQFSEKWVELQLQGADEVIIAEQKYRMMYRIMFTFLASVFGVSIVYLYKIRIKKNLEKATLPRLHMEGMFMGGLLAVFTLCYMKRFQEYSVDTGTGHISISTLLLPVSICACGMVLFYFLGYLKNRKVHIQEKDV